MVMMYVQRDINCRWLVLDKTEIGATFCFSISYETYPVQKLHSQWNSSINYSVGGRRKKREGEGEGEKSAKRKRERERLLLDPVFLHSTDQFHN